MTHVAHPYSQRLGIIRDWKNRWFVRDRKQFREYLKTDTLLREWLTKKLKGMFVADIEIERGQGTLHVIIKTARPGMLIGRSGEGVQKLNADIQSKLKSMKLSEMPTLKLDIEEVKNPESNAQIVAQMVVEGLEKRMAFRRVLKQTVEKVMANRDVEGVRIALAGRIGGSEMARYEELKKGRVPLQTLRADIEFAREEAYLAYTGLVGIKVWIYKGEVFEEKADQKKA